MLVIHTYIYIYSTLFPNKKNRNIPGHGRKGSSKTTWPPQGALAASRGPGSLEKLKGSLKALATRILTQYRYTRYLPQTGVLLPQLRRVTIKAWCSFCQGWAECLELPWCMMLPLSHWLAVCPRIQKSMPVTARKHSENLVDLN